MIDSSIKVHFEIESPQLQIAFILVKYECMKTLITGYLIKCERQRNLLEYRRVLSLNKRVFFFPTKQVIILNAEFCMNILAQYLQVCRYLRI